MSDRQILTEADVEHFAQRGFVLVPDCFSSSFASEWSEGVYRRLKADPKQWLTRYSEPRIPADSEDFDPYDPTMWGREWISVRGSQKWSIAEQFPKVWGAMCDLLGGSERIMTDFWTDYSAINLGTTKWRDVHPPWVKELLLKWKKPRVHADMDDESWHIDNPQRMSMLQGLRNGLVLIALVTDVKPWGGGTAIAPESAPKLSRMMSKYPDGVDMTDPTNTAPVMRECSEIVYAEGRTGDVYLTHPLLMHSITANYRGPRIIANPNIEMRLPMNLNRPADELSILERTTLDWVRDQSG